MGERGVKSRCGDVGGRCMAAGGREECDTLGGACLRHGMTIDDC